MSGTFSQMFPPKPTFTEAQLGDLSGKIFIVTGANSGVGLELAKMLYSRHGTVYIAARSVEKINKAIKSVKATYLKSRGELVALKLDLADLRSIKQSANEFLSKETRLDIVVHNAGVMTPPAGSKTVLGHDLEMGTNCLGPFLFNHFLEGVLKQTSASSEPGSVRIVWLSSLVNVSTPEGGIVFDEKTGGPQILKNSMENYMESKAGNVFLAHIAASKLADDGIISVSVNPGLMKTELQRHGPAIQGVIMKTLFKGPQYGAYTELFAALSPDVKLKDSGSFIMPWGRFGVLPPHLAAALKSKSHHNGTGEAKRFWEWCTNETKEFW